MPSKKRQKRQKRQKHKTRSIAGQHTPPPFRDPQHQLERVLKHHPDAYYALQAAERERSTTLPIPKDRTSPGEMQKQRQQASLRKLQAVSGFSALEKAKWEAAKLRTAAAAAYQKTEDLARDRVGASPSPRLPEHIPPKGKGMYREIDSVMEDAFKRAARLAEGKGVHRSHKRRTHKRRTHKRKTQKRRKKSSGGARQTWVHRKRPSRHRKRPSRHRAKHSQAGVNPSHLASAVGKQFGTAVLKEVIRDRGGPTFTRRERKPPKSRSPPPGMEPKTWLESLGIGNYDERLEEAHRAHNATIRAKEASERKKGYAERERVKVTQAERSGMRPSQRVPMTPHPSSTSRATRGTRYKKHPPLERRFRHELGKTATMAGI